MIAPIRSSPVSESPCGPQELITPIQFRSILKKEASRDLSQNKKIAWAETLIKTENEFERTEEEISRIFSDIWLSFPKMSFDQSSPPFDSCLSPYMPNDSSLPIEGVLSFIHDQVKSTSKSDKLSNILALHLLELIKKDPEVFDDVMELLQNEPEISNYLPSLGTLPQENVFLAFWLHYKIQNKSFEFADLLIKLIPLEDVARIKNSLELIEIVQKLSDYLPENFQFPAFAPNYTELEYQVSAAKKWLEDSKSELNTIEHLDLSDLEITMFPQEVIPYLSNVKSVSFSNNPNFFTLTLLNNLVKLPNLQHLELSCNDIENDSLLAILRAVENATQLRTLNLSGNPLSFIDAAPLIDLCITRNIDLILNSFSEEQDDCITFCSRLNDELRENDRLTWPSASLQRPELFLETLKSSLEECKYPLERISTLNLSETSIHAFPEIFIPYLPSITSMDLSENFLEEENLVHFLEILSQLPNLQELNLSSNQLDTSTLKALVNSIKKLESLKTLKLSENPFDIREFPELLKHCLCKDIKFISSLSRKQADLIRLFTHLGLPVETSSIRTLLDVSAEALSKIKNLDLSNLPIKTFPEELIPLLCHVEKVTFSHSSESPSQTVEIMTNLLKLPKLRSVNFSNNNLDNESLALLLNPIKEAQQLKQITLSNNPFTLRNVPELAAHCDLNEISLTRSYSIEEEDLLSVLHKLNEESQSFYLRIPDRFIDAQDLLEKVLPFLESQKEELRKIESLDFSNMHLQTIPSEVLTYLPNVKILYLRHSYLEMKQKHSALTRLVQMPQLKHIDLSSTLLTSSILATLSDVVRNPAKNLKKIDLLNCSYFPESFQKFIELCWEQEVALNRNYTEEESLLMDVFHKINQTLPSESQLTIPKRFVSPLHCLEIMNLELRGLKTLDLSNIPLNTLPKELFPYLSSVKTLILHNVSITQKEDFEILKELFKSSELRSIDLSHNNLGPKNLPLLLAALHEAKQIKNINVSNTGISNETSCRSFLTYCLKYNIKAIFSAI